MRLFCSCFGIWCDILEARLVFNNQLEIRRGFHFTTCYFSFLCWMHGFCVLMAKPPKSYMIEKHFNLRVISFYILDS